MNDVQLLKSFIVKNDGTQAVLAEAMGISLSALNAKINGTGGFEFKQREITFIKERYGLTDKEVNSIFFNQMVS
ncbi:hypothetical protein SDC9_127354 [bioreactor metagenome]|uniref:HTH cro/C1-type domain-containing protein n=1 Tax=bioreactor metagenome TaxID=1076179 RepID=A0A645CTQ9_9ZZZZ